MLVIKMLYLSIVLIGLIILIGLGVYLILSNKTLR
jgi:hypothetical protein